MSFAHVVISAYGRDDALIHVEKHQSAVHRCLWCSYHCHRFAQKVCSATLPPRSFCMSGGPVAQVLHCFLPAQSTCQQAKPLPRPADAPAAVPAHQVVSMADYDEEADDTPEDRADPSVIASIVGTAAAAEPAGICAWQAHILNTFIQHDGLRACRAVLQGGPGRGGGGCPLLVVEAVLALAAQVGFLRLGTDARQRKDIACGIHLVCCAQSPRAGGQGNDTTRVVLRWDVVSYMII